MFQKRLTPFACILISFLVCAVTFVAVSSNRSVAEQERLNELRAETASYAEYADFIDSVGEDGDKYTKLARIIDVLEGNYVRDYDDETLWSNIYRAIAVSIGDKYSQYFTVEEYDELVNSNDGDFVGIGVHATYDSETHGIYIFGVMPGSPAEKGGIQKGDIIVAAEGMEATEDNYYDMLDKIRGESGTEVTVTVLRNGEKTDYMLVRSAVASENVIYEKLDSDIAYVRILSFSDETLTAQFTSKIALAQNEGCTKFIFDVRNNSGGFLDEICSTLDLLLPEGTIINIVDKDGNTTTRDSDANCIQSQGMVVLCNGNTASAAELFTAALRDYGLAEIVGETTFGKGTMQTTYTLDDGSAIKMSTAFYNPPSNESYDGIGITPDYNVALPEEWADSFYKMPKEEDTQLKKAIELLSSTN